LRAEFDALGFASFLPDDEARYWALVRELTEIDDAIRRAERGAIP
jgi:hypothetical protein